MLKRVDFTRAPDGRPAIKVKVDGVETLLETEQKSRLLDMDLIYIDDQAGLPPIIIDYPEPIGTRLEGFVREPQLKDILFQFWDEIEAGTYRERRIL